MPESVVRNVLRILFFDVIPACIVEYDLLRFHSTTIIKKNNKYYSAYTDRMPYKEASLCKTPMENFEMSRYS